jgi:hypothetical protein
MPPRVSERTSTGILVCRCGISIRPGGKYFEVRRLPTSLSDTFGGRGFCSPQCVRDDFEDAIQILDSITTPDVDDLVSDLRSARLEIATVLNSIVGI